MRVLAKDIITAAKEGAAEAEVSGWVHRVRELGGIVFVIIRDRSGMVQLVLEEKPDFSLESVITARGKPTLNEKAPGGAELRAASFTVLSRAAPDLPYQVNSDISKTGLEAILDNRVLSLRNPKIRSIFRVQSTIAEAFAAYLRGQDFTEIKTSKLTAGSTEGGTNLFAVDYFDRRLYLAQSPQLYKEAMAASGLERVFEIAPVYRAEKHDTPRHLNEYVSLDLEMAFIESEQDLIEIEKGLLAHIFDAVARKNGADLAAWGADVPAPENVARAPTIGYEEALRTANADNTAGGRIFEINPEAERLLSGWAEREYGIALLFVNEFPRRQRPFYTCPLEDTAGKTGLTMSFDAIFRGIEITSGSRRLHDYDAARAALPKFGIREESMTAYLQLLKYGCPPHGGFAIGLERLTQKILGLANVKEASLFPRDRRRVEP
ncbi:MAG: aspartate--tRNA(Asn) ligase [Spirochaetaceae bacterium]|jgi:nondiscriminating aspartyl-tRNA synthetase|nr:aspartate--tRNA(Asn) ligase [Spirochaetaceae bacterium]